ncbi:DUF6311 domain-containing protein [Flavobacterium terrisoli]|uniref:DUF6311 domain-containing protein n=1 Tax=Flavobacterium terrisoli TaxID=3242195 RepID=UPI0025426FCE|nr:DUF6311 domain-containing protein [Flavobacterium buctense]
MEKIKKYQDSILLFVLTVIAFHFGLGFEKFNPANISWLFEARMDWSTHYLGWGFFRDAPWQFPLGSIDNYYYPIGTNIGFTDSIPLMAILLKTISFLLPANFQYFGLWLFICMFLNGYYSLKIFNYFKINKIVAFLLVIIILLNPIFIFRQIHPSYCAHWLLIGSIYLYLSTTNNPKVVSKNIKYSFLLLLLSSLITVYLTVAVFGFFALLLFKIYYFEKQISILKAIACLGSSLAMIFASWVLVGLIDFSKHTDIASTGFYGAYRLNLNALYNPMGYSRFLPAQDLVSGYQQDGFMYLGLGLILLFFISAVYLVISFIKSKKLLFSKKSVPLVVFCIGLSVFAATNAISFNDTTIFTIPFLDKMEKLGDIFRASARFFWSVYYLMIFYFIGVFNKIPLSKNIKIGLVSFLVLIQMVDVSPIFYKKETQLGDYKPALNINFWNAIFSNFKNAITVMPFNNDLVNFQDYQEIAFFAYKNKTTVTNGNLARYDGKIAQVFTNDLISNIIKGNFSTDNLYITSKENLKYFSPAYKKGLINIINSDGYYFVYSKSKKISNLPDNLPKDKSEFEVAQRENLVTTEFELCNTPLGKSNGEVKFNFENELFVNPIFQVKGWAFIENTDNNAGDSIFVYLKNDKNLYKKKSVQTKREDITIVFKKQNLDNSGFDSFAFTNNLEKGKYELIIAIKDKKGNLYYTNTNKVVNIGFEEFITPISTKLTSIKDSNLGLGVDAFDFKNNVLTIKGWAAFKEFESKKSVIEVLFLRNNETFSSETIANLRKDVTEALKNNINYDDSGFEAKIDTKSLPKGDYTIGIRIINKTFNKDSYIISDKKIKIE